MRVVVVVADPDPTSFTHAISATVQATLRGNGHDVTVLDLHEEGFRLAMSYDERAAYHSERPLLDPMVERHAGVVKRAEAFVFVYPTSLTTMPAILKGWLERTLVPGVGFVFDERHRVRRGLTDVHRLVGISTYAATWPMVKLTHDNGRRTVLRALRLNTAVMTRRSWLGLYEVGRRTAAERAAFLRRVERTMARL